MKDNYYFDNAATTLPKPEPVYQFMDQFFRSHGVNPGRSGHELAVEAEMMIIETRRLLGAFFGFGGDPARVTFSQNATDSMNAALSGILNPSDHMIITRMEHNCVLRPTNHFERDHDISVTRIGADSAGFVDPEEIRRSIQSNTRVVVVNHASNVMGSLQDAAAIGKVVRETDAVFILDTCQTAGVVPIAMDEWGIDVLVYTGHKGLFGPMGIGGMIVGENIEIRPPRTGGTGGNSISPFQPEEYPYRMETGTHCLPGIAGLNAAQKWFAELGRSHGADSSGSHGEICAAALAHVHETETSATQHLIDAFGAIDAVKIYGPGAGQPRVSTLSINIGELPADQVGAMLDADHAVCVRPGLHCAPDVHEFLGTISQKGTVRFAPGYFTDSEDLQQAVEAVRSIVED
ncbi:MAG: aminotransferase class V-fold PLP-dependent enzyme [Acidiferrobacteraceae bacterium]|nr:aminotransferase class V-fold PLP-dependent enzyme [Acidiferrobacteraceae bacterium]